MLGLEIITLFCFFSWASWEDFKKGVIPTHIILVPTALFFFWETAAFWEMFVPVFLILIAMWAFFWVLQKNKVLNPQKPYLGMGDVLGIPLAMGIVQAAFPVLGMIIFAVALTVEMPFFIKKRFIRLLPWLFLPTLLAILPRLFF